MSRSKKGGAAMNEDLYIFIDDSGKFDKNNTFFIYGCVYFYGLKEKDKASRLCLKIKKDFFCSNNEMKFSKIVGTDGKPDRKKRLKIAKKFGRFNTCCSHVSIPHIERVDLDNFESRCRYKDYMIKRMVVKIVESLVHNDQIDPDLQLNIRLFIDQQENRSNGKYDLEQSISRELTGQINRKTFLGMRKSNEILKMEPKIKLKFCKSHNHILIQAADIVAGYTRLSKLENSNLSMLKNNLSIKLP